MMGRRWRGILKTKRRSLAAFALMLATGLALPGWIDWPMRVSIAWDAGVVLYLGLVLRLALTEDAAAIRKRAAIDDEGAALILVITSTAAAVSFGAIIFQLIAGKAHPNDGEGWMRLAIAACTLVLSWFMVHMTFAVHYAHEYYGGARQPERGLDFPVAHGAEPHDPDYWDFFYFAANVGVAAQTADVNIVSRRIRRLVLGHSILSFLFNTLILALGVNLAASVING